jgi:hypothetical protein
VYQLGGVRGKGDARKERLLLQYGVDTRAAGESCVSNFPSFDASDIDEGGRDEGGVPIIDSQHGNARL